MHLIDENAQFSSVLSQVPVPATGVVCSDKVLERDLVFLPHPVTRGSWLGAFDASHKWQTTDPATHDRPSHKNSGCLRVDLD